MNNNENQLDGYGSFPTATIDIIPYWGSALSTFQQAPEEFEHCSDWGRQLIKHQSSELPNFWRNHDQYIQASTFLGQNMFRLSFEISHLCPRLGEFNEKVMEKYVEILIKILSSGQEPMVALFHWTLPSLFTTSEKENAWDHPRILDHFFFYIDRVHQYLSNKKKIQVIMKNLRLPLAWQEKIMSRNLIKYFISLNEPSTYNLNSFLVGVFPPFKRGSVIKFEKTLNLWVRIHDQIYEKFGHNNNNQSHVGISHNWTFFEGPLGYILQKFINERTMNKFERITGDYSDFFSLQYYCRFKLMPYLMHTFGPKLCKKLLEKYDFSDHPGYGDIYPQGIYKNLKRMHSMYPEKDLWVTEFGFADNSDLCRPHYLFETVREILTAVNDGIAIKGILVWSLADNYEWEQGMKVKFGLFKEIDLLRPHKGSAVKSWEVWQAILAFCRGGSSNFLDTLRARAYSQYLIIKNAQAI